MSHEDAIKALCDCAASVTILSYQEVIEGYFTLRGWDRNLIEQDGRTIDALRAEVKTVLQREADTIRRHDARIDAAEAERDALRAEVDAWREKYNALGASALEQVAKLGFENGRKDALIDALQADLAAAERRPVWGSSSKFSRR